MSLKAAAPNCIDIVAPFIDGYHKNLELPDIQLLGGVASAALLHPRTEIKVDERSIVTPDDFLENDDVQKALNPIRENRTLRDADILVLSEDPEEVASIKEFAEEKIGGKLEVEIFPYHDIEELSEMAEHPFGLRSLRTFVSDRYVAQDAGGTILKALFPFAVEVPDEALKTYDLEIGDKIFPVANPAAAIMNYWTRSISGLRPKDAKKFQKMAGLAFTKAPELAEWIIDGPGKSQMELAAIMHTLRYANSRPVASRRLEVGGAIQVTAGSVRALADHEAFMMPNADGNTRDAVLAMAIVKSRGIGIPESNERIVELYQRFVEQRLHTITHNE